MTDLRSKRVMSLLLAFVLVFGLAQGAAFAAGTTPADGANFQTLYTSEQLEAFKLNDRTLRPSGFIGFDGDYALEEGDSGEVSLIVEFVHQPPLVQQAEARIQGKSLPSLSEATRLADDDHIRFRAELNALFGSRSSNAATSSASYEITAEYKDAINGAAVTVPAGMAEEIAKLSTVWAVYPNVLVTLDPVKADGEYNTEAYMANSRDLLGIDSLHEQGITGEGITVGVIDTGVDYRHPDLAGAFRSDIKAGSDLAPIEGIYYGRNFVEHSEYGIGWAERAGNDPMESSYEDWLSLSEAVRTELFYNDPNYFLTYHGTHVSGTVVARGVNEPDAALGMAPEAALLVYRVLGPNGGYTSWIMSALDKVYEDGCDVVNMSLGASMNDPAYITSIAVNNLILQHDIVFAVSAGNGGPTAATIGDPGTSSLAITVANGTLPESRVTMELPGVFVYNPEFGSLTDYAPVPMRLLVEDPGTQLLFIDYSFQIIMPGEEYDPYYGSYPLVLLKNAADIVDDEGTALYPNADPVGCAYINVFDWEGNATEASFTLGTGKREEFEYKKDIIPGSIVLVNRGEIFLETAALAREYGARAVIVLDYSNGEGPDGSYGSPQFQDSGTQYAPLFFMDNNTSAGGFVPDGWNNINARMLNGGPDYETVDYYEDWETGELVPIWYGLSTGFDNFRDDRLDPSLYSAESGSSRGPVGSTMDIKPDITAPGHIIDSTVPYYAADNFSPDAPVSYDSAYMGASGTSMASPHIAGIAALMLQYSRENSLGNSSSGKGGWSASEIKARLMNTADELSGSQDYHFSVYEKGAGYVNPLAAMAAESYVTVSDDRIYLPAEPNESTNPEFPTTVFGAGELASFNFRSLKAGQDEPQAVTLDATLYNPSGGAKTFLVDYSPNYAGFEAAFQSGMVASAELWQESGIHLSFSSGTLEVAGGGEATFSVTANVPANVSHNGFFEGYVTLTNSEDASEVYRLPFALVIRPDQSVETIFLTHPSFTTRSLAFVDDGFGGVLVQFDLNEVHTEDSFYSTLYLALGETAYEMLFFVAPAGITDITDQSQWLGEMAYSLPLYGMQAGVMYKELMCIDPIFIEYTNAEHTEGQLSIFAPGEYTLIAVVLSPFGVSYNPVRFNVDNDVPAFSIDGLEDDVYRFSGPSAEETVLRGNIYDQGLADLAAADIQFAIYEPNDFHGPDADQALNAIFARIGEPLGDLEERVYTSFGEGEWFQAEIAPNGDYELHLRGLDPAGTSTVEIFYYDHYAIADYEGISGLHYEWEFHPDWRSQTKFMGYPFAFYGANQGHKIITVQHEGPALAFAQPYVTVLAGDSVSLTPALNEEAQAAGFSEAFTWSSADERVATVDAAGSVTAAAWGSTFITASARSGDEEIRASFKITVPGKGDGLPNLANTQIWYGSYEYEDYADFYGAGELEIASWASYAIDEYWNSYFKIPMLWEYKGEENRDGLGDRMYTFYSAYSLKTMPFSAEGAAYADSDVAAYLNGAFLEEAFSAGEQNAIPYYTVLNGIYDAGGNLVGVETLENQRVYLPWGIHSSADSRYAGSVFWTAGNEESLDYTMKGASSWKNHKRAKNTEQLFWMSYYLRNPAPNAGEVLYVEGYEGDIRSADTWDYYSETLGWYDQGGWLSWTEAEIGYAVAPVIKLDMDSVLFAHRISDFEGDDTSVASGSLYLKIDESASYKLTVLGGNNGADVGSLSGVPTGPVKMEGYSLSLPELSSSASGIQYKIAVKVVGEGANGDRVLLDYKEYDTAEDAQSITIDLAGSASDDYMVYVYLLDRGAIGITDEWGGTPKKYLDRFDSFEAGVVYEIPVSCGLGSYTISFDTGEGSPVESQTVLEGTLAAMPEEEPLREGYIFEGWYADSGCTLPFDFANTAINSDTIIYAKWSAAAINPPPVVQAFTVRFETNGGSAVDPLTVFAGSTIDAPATAREGYTFGGWYTGQDFANPVTFPFRPAANLSLYARWIPVSGGEVESKAVEIPVVLDENGKGTAAVEAEDVAKDIEALAEGEALVLTLDAGDLALSLGAGLLEALNEGDKPLQIQTKEWAVVFDSATLRSLGGETVLTVSKADTATLPEKAAGEIEGKPVYSFTLTRDGAELSGFGGGKAFVSIPYTPEAGENPAALIAVRLGDDGEWITQRGKYNSETNTLDFVTTHFSTYALRYAYVGFSDVAQDAWYYDAVTFAAARGITTGKGGGLFAPGDTLTREQFLVMLMRAYGIEPDEEMTEGLFTDIDTEAYYASFLSKAQRMGITKGIGGNLFGVGQSIKRQDMFTLLYNLMNEIGELPPVKAGGSSLDSFPDSTETDTWALDALRHLVAAGIVNGSDGKLDPQGCTNRAMMTQVIYNLLG